MKILIACEYTATVRKAFRRRGHNAVSCDLLLSERPGPHLRMDVLTLLDRGWDMMIAFPPCTFICNSGAKHLYNNYRKENGINLIRWRQMIEGAKFFRSLWQSNIPKIGMENPIMLPYPKKIIGAEPSQIIQPWQFGHREMKATCLWLKNLPPLVPTHIVGPPPKDSEQRKSWARIHRMSPGPNRGLERSRTYEGIAEAMAKQWG